MKFKRLLVALGFAMAATSASAVDLSSGDLNFKINANFRQYVDSDHIKGVTGKGTKLTGDVTNLYLYADTPLDEEGWKAYADIRTNLVVDNAGAATATNATAKPGIGDDRALVGIKSGWFNVGVGRDETQLWRITRYRGIFDEMYAGPSGQIHNLGGRRFNNAIFAKVKITPDWEVGVDYKLSETRNTDGTVQTPSIVYGTKMELTNNLEFQGAYFDGTPGNMAAQGALTLKIPELKTKITGIISRNEVSYEKWNGYEGVVVYSPTEKVDLIGGLGMNDREAGNLHTYSLGANYKLSKSVKLMARATRWDTNGVTYAYGNAGSGSDAIGSGTDRTQVGVGLEVKF